MTFVISSVPLTKYTIESSLSGHVPEPAIGSIPSDRKGQFQQFVTAEDHIQPGHGDMQDERTERS